MPVLYTISLKRLGMYAVLEVKGKQYKAEKGAVLKVDYMEGEAGTLVSMDSVLMVSGNTIAIGAPYVKGASVKASIKEQGRDKKIIVFKYKPKKHYRRTRGHRQKYTLLAIDDIIAG
jgi:large subunit ribosomal protein L21